MIHILPTTIILTLLLLSQTLASSTTTPRNWSVAKLIRVDNSAPGRGDFETIQEAIDSVPSNNSELVFIWVKPGVYVEKVVVPKDKPFVTLGGTKAAANETVVTWNEKGGIFESATFSVLAPYFVARYLTIQVIYHAKQEFQQLSGGKAVALRVSGDKAAFYDCRILSYQDTLLDDNGSHYYRNCYIEGATDFICGDASSLFEVRYIFISIGYDTNIHGSITAHDRDSESDQTGYVFLGCKVTGVGATLLGRAWGSYSRVVYAYSYLASNVLPIGWSDWGDKSKQRYEIHILFFDLS
ncbi:Putative pectinesterase 11 [Linum grandiflorum]